MDPGARWQGKETVTLSEGKPRKSFITPQQAEIHSLFVRHRSMSIVARELGLSMIRVREALVQFQRNTMRDAGLSPPPLREMQRGAVGTRFGVARAESGGRPAKHAQHDPIVAGRVSDIPARPDEDAVSIAGPGVGTRRWLVTGLEAGALVHRPFWTNLRAYAARIDAEIVVLRLGRTGLLGKGAEDIRPLVREGRIDIGGVVDVAADIRVPLQSNRPLDGLANRRSATWTIIGHPVVQLETLARIRAGGLKVQMTTGVVTRPRGGSAPAWPSQLGAVIVELTAGNAAHCRHITADPEGDGSFQDLQYRVVNGTVTARCRVEALTFGDIHHAHLDPAVAAATWGGGAPGIVSDPPLIDVLRPRFMIFHDLADFSARNHHEARDHHQRFAQMAAGRDCVRTEMRASSEFLIDTRRPWARSIVVGSNHDDALVHWLRDADFREDPRNAVFFLEASLALHHSLAAGKGTDGLFEKVLRRLGSDGLARIRFLKMGESLEIAGIEHGLHGHLGSDGKRGGMPFFERLGIRATLGHTHRPTTRGGLYCAGVCQTALRYARGPLTSWAVAHVVTYADGARQHLFLNDGRFFG